MTCIELPNLDEAYGAMLLAAQKLVLDGQRTDVSRAQCVAVLMLTKAVLELGMMTLDKPK
jgi:hypothetical protein